MAHDDRLAASGCNAAALVLRRRRPSRPRAADREGRRRQIRGELLGDDREPEPLALPGERRRRRLPGPDPRRSEAALTYTSAPLAHNLEITGHPVVTLDVTSTAADGAFIVYLEDVAPGGRVTYITEGELRAIHRKISSGRPPYHVFGPYHSFLRADAEPLVPGRVAELRFALLPTSVLIHKNHRIRIAVAGADRGTFARIPAAGNPVVTVARNAVNASAVDLPVRPR